MDIISYSLASKSLKELRKVNYGELASEPTLRPDGSAIQHGDVYYNSTSSLSYSYTGTGWEVTNTAVQGIFNNEKYISTADQDTFAIIYEIGYVEVYVEGIKLIEGSDYTANNNTSVVLSSPIPAGMDVELVSFSRFELTDNALVKTSYEANADTNAYTDSEKLTNNKIDNTAITSVTFNADGTLTIVTP